MFVPPPPSALIDLVVNSSFATGTRSDDSLPTLSDTKGGLFAEAKVELLKVPTDHVDFDDVRQLTNVLQGKCVPTFAPQTSR